MKIAITADVHLHVDHPERLNALRNILDNAIKYSDKNPEVVISTRLSDKDIIIEFKDSGIGIRKEHLKSMFEPLLLPFYHDI